MLALDTFIYNPTFISGTTYTAEMYYSPASQAKFIRLDDVVTDKDSKRYKVIAPTVLPVIDGSTITLEALDANELPTEDSNYDSFIETPDQEDSRPEVSTGGNIDSAVLVSGPNYSYRISASWVITEDANQSEVGDRIVDSEGKEYKILSFDTPASKWGDTVVVEEIEKIGNTPNIGKAGLYNPTTNKNYYQGPTITDNARIVAQNRDKYYIDKEIGSGSGGDTNGDWRKIPHVITSGEITAKSFTFSPTPKDDSEVSIVIAGAPSQVEGEDYEIINNVFSWNGLGLDGSLVIGDIITLSYFS